MRGLTRSVSLSPRFVPDGVAVACIERPHDQQEHHHTAQLAALCSALHGAEEQLSLAGLAAARSQRQADFLGGRWCARECLRVVAPELIDQRIGVGRNREPIWPTGVTGSIAHGAAYVLAASARTETVQSIGIDVAPWLDEDAPSRIGDSIVVAGELEALLGAEAWSTAQRLTVVFSAKESIYKALYPLVQRVFGFDHAQVTRIVPDDETTGRFNAHLTGELAHLPLHYPLVGRYECREDAVFSAVTQPALR